MKTNWTRWIWLALAAAVLFQLYPVRELLAAFLLLSVVFAAFAALVLALNGVHWVYLRAFAGVESVARADFSRKPFRRLRSMTAR